MSQYLQTLINDGAGGTVHLPAGVHEVDGTLTVPTQTSVVGTGLDCVLYNRTTGPAIQTTRGEKQRIAHLSIVGTFRRSAPGVLLTQPLQAHVHDLEIVQNGEGVACAGLMGSTIERVGIHSAWARKRYHDMGLETPAGKHATYGLSIRSKDRYSAALSSLVRDLTVNAGVSGVYAEVSDMGIAADLSMEGGWIQGLAGPAIYVNATKRLGGLTISRLRCEALPAEFLLCERHPDRGGLDRLSLRDCTIRGQQGQRPAATLWRCQRLRCSSTQSLGVVSMGTANYDAEVDALSVVQQVTQ